jgi:predicted nucleotidyltransferase
MMNHFTIYEVISGSRAYGFANENSDTDIRGIFMPNINCFYGLDGFKDPQETKNPDKVLYSLKKFASLALANNPNILELLWIDKPELILKDDGYIYRLKEIREHFLSKRIFTTYLGYVKAQMHKIKNEGNCSPEMNGKRMENIKKNGYDTKAASHVFRLLFQGLDLATDKKIYIPLSKDEANCCKATREGKINFNNFVEFSTSLINDFKALEIKSDLPDEPNYNLINNVVIDLNIDFYDVNHF